MKKYLWVGSVLVVAVIAVVLSQSHKRAAPVATGDKPVIKIGLIAPLAGNLSFLGEAAKNGANLAMDEINANPNLHNKYELVIENDSFDPVKSVAAANKLITIDHVDAMIGLGTPPGNAVNPIAERNKTPYICMASDANVAKGEYNFTNWTQPHEEVTLMLAELQKRNLKKVALITQNQQGWLAITNDFKARAGALGITVVEDQTFNDGTKDFKTMIAHAKKQNPDIYVLGAFSPELEILGKQIKEQGIKTPLTSIESFGLSSDPSIFEGMWFIDAAVTIPGGFRDKYIAKYKEVGPGAPSVYDSIHLIVSAAEKATNGTKPSGADIAKQLSVTNDYSGALGAITVNADGQFLSQASVKIVKGGKAVEDK